MEHSFSGAYASLTSHYQCDCKARRRNVNDGMTGSDNILQNKRRQTRRERPPSFYLCCHLVLNIYFPLFPFSQTLPSSVTLPISTVLLPNALLLNSSEIIITSCFLLPFHLFTLKLHLMHLFPVSPYLPLFPSLIQDFSLSHSLILSPPTLFTSALFAVAPSIDITWFRLSFSLQ